MLKRSVPPIFYLNAALSDTILHPHNYTTNAVYRLHIKWAQAKVRKIVIDD